MLKFQDMRYFMIFLKFSEILDLQNFKKECYHGSLKGCDFCFHLWLLNCFQFLRDDYFMAFKNF